MKLGDVIPDESHWCQHELGLTEQGDSIEPSTGMPAARMCVFGGLMVIHGYMGAFKALDKLDKITRKRTGQDAVDYNNSHDWPDVQSLIAEYDALETH